MKSIGIVYIATGPYIKFWEGFYESFLDNFLPTCERKWCVFSDAVNVSYEGDKNVYRFYIENKPWPLITLLRFNTFLLAEDILKGTDYVFFFNANAYCKQQISLIDIIGDGTANLILAQHPGFMHKKPIDFTYERDPHSLAYVPYNYVGASYVQGSFVGGKTNSFLTMCKCLKGRIEADLKNNIIALYHDESHLNRYLCGRTDYKVLSVEYNYPEDFHFANSEAYNQKIVMRNKSAYFDVRKLKYEICVHDDEKKSYVRRIVRNIYVRTHKGLSWTKRRCLFMRDTIQRKRVPKIS